MKKNFKRFLSIVMVFATVFSYFAPFIKVSAASNVIITIDVANSSDVTLTAKSMNTSVGVGVTGDNLVGERNGSETIIDFIDTFNNQHYLASDLSIVCASNKNCTATVNVPDEHGVKVVVGGNAPFSFKKGENTYDNSPLASGSTITIVNRNVEENTPFDGKAYLIWSCKNGGTCYHYFDNLQNSPIFISNTLVKDDRTDEVFDVNAEVKNFALKADFESWQQEYKSYHNISSINWSKLDPNEIVGFVDMRKYEEDAIKDGECTRENTDREDFEHCVDNYVQSKNIFVKRAFLKPVGEPTLNNAYVSYGDRNFKITIYNNKYRAISIGDLSDLHYYPASWSDALVRTDSYDVSKTTKDNPTVIDAVLLESTINIDALTDFNGFIIDKIEALDVPQSAIDINKVDNTFKITFKSNFYDKVVFKITDKEGNEYFFRINRITLDTRDEIRFREGEPGVKLETLFYFDRTTSYKDYKLTGKIEYLDGTSDIIELKNSKNIDDGLGNRTYAYEVDLENTSEGPAGKGLKVANYSYEFTIKEAQKIARVYLNVEYSGSSSTEYAGAFAGSGKGVVVEFKEEK